MNSKPQENSRTFFKTKLLLKSLYDADKKMKRRRTQRKKILEAVRKIEMEKNSKKSKKRINPIIAPAIVGASAAIPALLTAHGSHKRKLLHGLAWGLGAATGTAALGYEQKKYK